MAGKLLQAAAAFALVIAFLGLRASTSEVSHYAVQLQDGVPAVVYEPGGTGVSGPLAHEEARMPVVILAHALVGNAGGAMSVQARHLARGGYAVIVPELRGHGRNRRPLDLTTRGTPSGPVEDLDAAVLFARSHARFDGERIALVGYSFGGSVALEYASRDPSVAAVVSISGAGSPEGAYPPPNVLLLWAERDPAGRRARLRALGARLAGLQRVVAGRTYGELGRGSAVRVGEVRGVDHLTLPYSPEVARRVLDWLRLTVGPGVRTAAEPVSDGRFGWSLLGLVAAGVLAWGLIGTLAPLLPREELPPSERPLRRLALLAGALLAALLLLSGGDTRVGRGPFGFLPLEAARDLLGFLALSGVPLWVWLALRGRIRIGGLLDPRSHAGAGLLLGFSYLAIGAMLEPLFDLWPAPHRIPWCLACALLALPYFAATEWLLRGEGRTGAWLPVLGKLLTLAVLLLGCAGGLLPRLLLVGIGAIAPGLLVLEIFAYRLSRVAPGPWVPALFQAGWVGWCLGALFPLVG